MTLELLLAVCCLVTLTSVVLMLRRFASHLLEQQALCLLPAPFVLEVAARFAAGEPQVVARSAVLKVG